VVAPGVRPLQVPYDYTIRRRIRNTANLRDRWDVIVFGPGGGQAAVEGTPKWKNAHPVEEHARNTEHRRLAQTERHSTGMGLEGLIHLRNFIAQRRRLHRLQQQCRVAISNNFGYGVSTVSSGSTTRVVARLLGTRSSMTRAD